MNKTVKTMMSALLVSGFLVLSVDAAYVVLKDNRRMQGTDIRVKPNGDVVLQSATGLLTFPASQVAQAVADKPASFDQAMSLAGSGRYDQAAALLEQIAKDYAKLGWDIKAYEQLGLIYLNQKEPSKSVQAYEKLFRVNSDSEKDVDTLKGYREALFAAKQYDKLKLKLDDAVASGSRAEAARAQIMRGDIKAASGDLEGAALDYFRTAILFEKQKDQHAEALYKAGDTLAQLRDARANDLFRDLLNTYPDSEWTQKARSRG